MRGTSITRRQALASLAAVGTVSLVGLGRRTRTWAAACAVSPAQTEGPYFVDEGLERSDIRIDPSDGSIAAGVPLQLTINVHRADADCAPAAGVRVDVWHASAAGVYSDETANGTVGKKFCRGYQVTDANGAVRFTTIYPGWYSGRTIHIHVKLRTFDGTQTSFDFTSQLYFDESVNDSVMAQAPYNARGNRDTTNASDGIFGDGGAQLMVALTADGSGGYAGTFGFAVDGLPATSTCADLAACRAAVAAVLPQAASATGARSRRVAKRLAMLYSRAGAALDQVASATGTRRTRLLRIARQALQRLRAQARSAAAKGTLDTALAPLDEAVTALIALLS